MLPSSSSSSLPLLLLRNTSSRLRLDFFFGNSEMRARVSRAVHFVSMQQKSARAAHIRHCHTDRYNEGLTTWYYLNLFTSKCGNKRLLQVAAVHWRRTRIHCHCRSITHTHMDMDLEPPFVGFVFSEDEFIVIVGMRKENVNNNNSSARICGSMKPKLWTHKPFAHTKRASSRPLATKIVSSELCEDLFIMCTYFLSSRPLSRRCLAQSLNLNLTNTHSLSLSKQEKLRNNTLPHHIRL